VAFGYALVILAAISTQFIGTDMPCPLCVLQRMAMMLIGIAAIWMVGQARKGMLTLAAYARSYGLMIVAAMLGATMSTRQIELHILPGDAGYGDAVLGLHLYTWALITFVIVMIYVGAALMMMPKSIPAAPAAGTPARTVSTLVIWLFIAVVAANVVAIIFLEGFAGVLPDDPAGYHLIEQFSR